MNYSSQESWLLEMDKVKSLTDMTNDESGYMKNESYRYEYPDFQFDYHFIMLLQRH